VLLSKNNVCLSLGFLWKFEEKWREGLCE